eukprot:COSAG03_NODE_2003_length_3237_cov_1683.336520_1_plen_73_part_10
MTRYVGARAYTSHVPRVPLRLAWPSVESAVPDKGRQNTPRQRQRQRQRQGERQSGRAAERQREMSKPDAEALA